DARRGDREVESVSREDLEVRRRHQAAVEGAHAGSSLPGLQHAQRLPVADLHSTAQYPTQQTDRRSEGGSEFPAKSKSIILKFRSLMCRGRFMRSSARIRIFRSGIIARL